MLSDVLEDVVQGEVLEGLLLLAGEGSWEPGGVSGGRVALVKVRSGVNADAAGSHAGGMDGADAALLGSGGAEGSEVGSGR